jgi:hypothetical protein
VAAKKGALVPTLLVFHEVDDVEHWLASPKREEFFAPRGMTARTFRDAQGSNRVGLIVEVPDIADWEAALQSAEAAEAMKHDGVRPETIVAMVAG